MFGTGEFDHSHGTESFPGDFDSEKYRAETEECEDPISDERSGSEGETEQQYDEDSERMFTGLCNATDVPELREAHAAAGQLYHLYGRIEEDVPDQLTAMISVARGFATVVDHAVARRLVPEDGRASLRDGIVSLGEWLGVRSGRGEQDDRPPPPMWLDVASPAHSRVTVCGVRTRFENGCVTAGNATTVVLADNSRIHARDHYHLRRVSLDCRSMYGNSDIMTAFVSAMADPSRGKVWELRRLLKDIVHPDQGAERRHIYRERLPGTARREAEGAEYAFLGDNARADVTTPYYVDETVVPLAELLYLKPELIAVLAAGYRLGAGADSVASLVDALAGMEDLRLLRHATGLDTGDTSVGYEYARTRVDLAAAVMVGYGNELRTSTELKINQTDTGNLRLLDRAMAEHEAGPQGKPIDSMQPPQPVRRLATDIDGFDGAIEARGSTPPVVHTPAIDHESTPCVVHTPAIDHADEAASAGGSVRGISL